MLRLGFHSKSLFLTVPGIDSESSISKFGKTFCLYSFGIVVDLVTVIGILIYGVRSGSNINFSP